MARTVLIVDDHPEFRACVLSLLEAEGLEVVGQAADGETAIAAALALRPDLVLLDVRLPDIDGFEVARRLAALDARQQIVLTSSHGCQDFASLVARSPARGFLCKDAISGPALRKLLSG